MGIQIINWDPRKELMRPNWEVPSDLDHGIPKWALPVKPHWEVPQGLSCGIPFWAPSGSPKGYLTINWAPRKELMGPHWEVPQGLDHGIPKWALSVNFNGTSQ
jgi:hypothetical protein